MYAAQALITALSNKIKSEILQLMILLNIIVSLKAKRQIIILSDHYLPYYYPTNSPAGDQGGSSQIYPCGVNYIGTRSILSLIPSQSPAGDQRVIGIPPVE